MIEIRALHKEYRRLRGGSTLALNGLDLDIPAGGVFGLLGPNGSGKTTTIRCMLGLARPTSGTCRVFGRDPNRDLHEVVRQIGSIVEAPALFPTFSGRRNLELLASMYSLDKARIDAVLEEVGLADRQRDLVKTYSLGMRQRLAIAAALLKDPRLLILDEPANGLDPAGIREVRRLLRRLGDEGRTVVVSSHILSEIQQVCDHLAILSGGRCITAGPVRDVLERSKVAGMVVRVDDTAAATAALAKAGITTVPHEDALRVDVEPSSGARVSKALADAGLYPSELRPVDADLESVFLELTEDTGGAA